MINLLINDHSEENKLTETSFGGLPVKEAGTDIEWPKCEICEAEMQYLGKIKTDVGLELIFMCNADPGMCEQWSPDDGGNKVIIIEGGNLEFFNPADPKLALREIQYGAKVIESDGDDYDSVREHWEGNRRDVLGKLYGEPDWLQGEETPECSCCSKPMRLVAQLEEGPGDSTSMNFGGGGIAYLFDCTEGKTAKFLWQC